MDMGQRVLAFLVICVGYGQALPVAWALAAADPIFIGIAQRVAPMMRATLKSQTLSLLKGLEPGGNERHSFWLTTPW